MPGPSIPGKIPRWQATEILAETGVSQKELTGQCSGRDAYGELSDALGTRAFHLSTLPASCSNQVQIPQAAAGSTAGKKGESEQSVHSLAVSPWTHTILSRAGTLVKGSGQSACLPALALPLTGLVTVGESSNFSSASCGF